MPSLVFRSVALDLVRLQEVIEETSRRHELEKNTNGSSSSTVTLAGGLPKGIDDTIPTIPPLSSSAFGNSSSYPYNGTGTTTLAQPYSAPRLKSIFSPERGMNMNIRMTILKDMDEASHELYQEKKNTMDTKKNTTDTRYGLPSMTANRTEGEPSNKALVSVSSASFSSTVDASHGSTLNSTVNNTNNNNNNTTIMNDPDTTLTSILGVPDRNTRYTSSTFPDEQKIRSHRKHRFAETLQGPSTTTTKNTGTVSTNQGPSSSSSSPVSSPPSSFPNPTIPPIQTTQTNDSSNNKKNKNSITKIPSFNSIKDEPVDAPAPVEPPSPLATKPKNSSNGNHSGYPSRVNSNLDLSGTASASSSTANANGTTVRLSVPSSTTNNIQPLIGLSLDDDVDTHNTTINTTRNPNLSTLVNYSAVTVPSLLSPSSPPSETTKTNNVSPSPYPSSTAPFYYNQHNPILPMSPLVPNTVRRTNVPLATGDKRGLRSGALFSPIAPYPETLRKENTPNNGGTHNDGNSTNSPVTGIPLAVPFPSSSSKDNGNDTTNTAQDRTTLVQPFVASAPTTTVPMATVSSSNSSSVLATTLPATSQALHRAVTALAEAYATERMRAEALSVSQGATADQVVALAETLAAVQAVANRLEETTRILLPNKGGSNNNHNTSGFGSPLIQGQLQSPVGTNDNTNTNSSYRSPSQMHNFSPTKSTVNTRENFQSLSPRQEPSATSSAAAVPVPSLSVRLSSPPLTTPHTLPHLTGTGNVVMLNLLPPPVSTTLPLTNSIVPKRNGTTTGTGNNTSTTNGGSSSNDLPLTVKNSSNALVPETNSTTRSSSSSSSSSSSFSSTVTPPPHHPWVAGMLSPRRLPPTQGISNTVTNNLRVQIPNLAPVSSNTNDTKDKNNSNNTLERTESVPLLSPPVPKRESYPESKLVESLAGSNDRSNPVLVTSSTDIQEEESMGSPLSPTPLSSVPVPVSTENKEEITVDQQRSSTSSTAVSAHLVSQPSVVPKPRSLTILNRNKVSPPPRANTVISPPPPPPPSSSSSSPTLITTTTEQIVTPPCSSSSSESPTDETSLPLPSSSTVPPVLTAAENVEKLAYLIRQENDPFFAPRSSNGNGSGSNTTPLTTTDIPTNVLANAVEPITTVTSSSSSTSSSNGTMISPPVTDTVSPWADALFNEIKNTVISTPTPPATIALPPPVDMDQVPKPQKSTASSISAPPVNTVTLVSVPSTVPVEEKETTRTVSNDDDEKSTVASINEDKPDGSNTVSDDGNNMEGHEDVGEEDENRSETVDEETETVEAAQPPPVTTTTAPPASSTATSKTPTNKKGPSKEETEEVLRRQEQKEREEYAEIQKELTKEPLTPKRKAPTSPSSSAEELSMSSSSTVPSSSVPANPPTTTNNNTSNTGKTNGLPSNVDPSLVQLVLDLLNGHIFIKHGRTGWPHPRLVWLDATGAELGLRWGKPQEGIIGDPSQYKSDAWISLGDINAIEKGRGTKVLIKSGKTSKENLYWAIIGANRTLDLEAHTPEERNLWAEGFAKLMQEPNILQEIMVWLFNHGHWSPPGLPAPGEANTNEEEE